MNIFDQYLDKIKKIILDLSKKGKIILPDNLDGINTEIPPEKFNCDISTCLLYTSPSPRDVP